MKVFTKQEINNHHDKKPYEMIRCGLPEPDAWIGNCINCGWHGDIGSYCKMCGDEEHEFIPQSLWMDKINDGPDGRKSQECPFLLAQIR